MKKILSVLFALSLTVVMTGCSGTGNKGFFGVVKNVLIGDDYEEAGRMVGKAGYTAYVIMKGDPKYDKYTKKAEEIYVALDNAENFDEASVNQIFLEVLRAALQTRYGYLEAEGITMAVRIGGAIADRMIIKNVSSTDAKLYLKGLKEGVDEARAETPQEFLDEAAAKAAEKAEKEANKKEAKYITCTEGQCDYDFTKMRGTSKQLNLAKELKKDGWLDYTEQKTEEVLVTKAENVEHFIERTTNLKKLKIKTLKVWIGKMKVDSATHKLVSIQFLREDLDGNVMETTCVACEGDLELMELEDKE
jgi:hypothetical protein